MYNSNLIKETFIDKQDGQILIKTRETFEQVLIFVFQTISAWFIFKFLECYFQQG